MQTTKTDRREHPVPVEAPTFRLLFSGSQGLVHTPAIVLPPGDLTIGRALSTSAGIGLPQDDRASRLHARLLVHPPPASGSGKATVELIDQESKNGTFVNGKRIGRCVLADGDVIRVAHSLMLLRYEPSQQVDAPLKELIGRSPAIRLLRSQLARRAAMSTTVLLVGESGTGKELAARALHQLYQVAGRKGRFVPVNCAAIPEQLAEGQLFGHVAGAFTDARDAHEGFFRAAGGGTLFLDEIGELALLSQAKLLRALEEQNITPVGSTRPVPCDVRLVAATNRDLRSAIAAGHFRGDLYARLSALPVELPPLRARREDILQLLDHFWDGKCPPLSAALVEALLLYPWPYNVRELVNLALYLQMCAVDRTTLDVDLVIDKLNLNPDKLMSEPSAASKPTEQEERAGLADQLLPPPSKGPPIARETLIRLLKEHRWNKSLVGRIIGRHPRTLRRWLTDLNITDRPAETAPDPGHAEGRAHEP